MKTNLLAQYEGAAQPGQVLGESTSWGLPSWILLLVAFLVLLFILFLAFKRRRKDSKKGSK